ncbi:hypothetical protein KVR01_013378 [Diaporthe batatas]|uniref:uncharacterized protein n=1 Tax=Diaporthe batatas TaxID=748121 RepID=UPI001D0583B5|nr:uncharacterized protein KVR01_013378 [Diaporthe batatas]KAG8156773.1 hypothetical protein KVR01_013378 [Diaporthe batatas]
MSSYTLADGTLPHATAAVKVLSHLLDKVEQSTSPSPEALLAARLHESMLPLASQFHFVADWVVKLVARLEGTEPKSLGAHDSLKTVADARARIDAAAAVVASADAAKIASRSNELVEFGMGPGKPPGHLKAQDYAAGYSLPNIYFHVTTAYNILRKEGIELGKRDFIAPFISPYMS